MSCRRSMTNFTSFLLFMFAINTGGAQNSDKGSCYTGTVKLFESPPTLSDADRIRQENICVWKDSVCVAFRNDTLPRAYATYGCFPLSKVSSVCGTLASKTNRSACQPGELNGEKGELCCCLGDNCNGQPFQEHINTVQCKVGSKIASGVVPSQDTFCTILSMDNNVEKMFMCYSFQPKDNSTYLNYGCSPITGLPSGCTKTLVGTACEPGYNYDEFGSVCCCQGNNCNAPGANNSSASSASTGASATLVDGSNTEAAASAMLLSTEYHLLFVWIALLWFTY